MTLRMVLAFTFLGLPVLACEANVPDQYLTMEVRKSCAFDFAGKEDGGHADSAHDVGAGRVTQMVWSGGRCVSVEYLVAADCNQGKAIVIEGQNPPCVATAETPCFEVAGFFYDPIGPYLFPRGPINFDKDADIDEVAELGRSVGLNVTPVSQPITFPSYDGDSFDPLCGCKLFYPELAEATQ